MKIKKNRFWLDTETTGIQAAANQLLEYAVIVEDHQGQELARCEAKILLKPSVKPEPGALAANNINPMSDEWIADAITEKEAAQRLYDLSQKFIVDGQKPIFSAYNANFDKNHIEAMLLRSQIKFDDCFNRSMTDPYSTAKRLVDEKVIETRMLKRKRGPDTNSVRLEHVAEALKLQGTEPAHRALADTETLIRVTREMYRLVTGKSIYDASASPEDYSPGQIISIISDSQSAGFKLRPIMVLLNKSEEKKVLSLDLADYKKVGLFSSNLKLIDYDSIMDEVDPEEAVRIEIQNVYDSNIEYYKIRIK